MRGLCDSAKRGQLCGDDLCYGDTTLCGFDLDDYRDMCEECDEEDEKHVHPLQLDVISRAVELWSNPGETVLTPFMGVGSEVYAAVRAGRRGLGIELKPSYYRQAIKNLATVEADTEDTDQTDFGFVNGVGGSPDCAELVIEA